MLEHFHIRHSLCDRGTPDEVPSINIYFLKKFFEKSRHFQKSFFSCCACDNKKWICTIDTSFIELIASYNFYLIHLFFIYNDQIPKWFVNSCWYIWMKKQKFQELFRVNLFRVVCQILLWMLRFRMYYPRLQNCKSFNDV